MRTGIYTKIILAIIATTLIVIALKPYIASRNTEKINESEILADVGKDLAALSDKVNLDEKKEADRQRDIGQSAKTTTPNDEQPAPQRSGPPVASKAPSDSRAVVNKMVEDDLKVSEDHGMIASIRGGASRPGDDNDLPLGPVVKASAGSIEMVHVPFVPTTRLRALTARLENRGEDWTNGPPSSERIDLRTAAVQAVLGRDGQPITGRDSYGIPTTLIQLGGMYGYIPTEVFSKFK